MGRIFAGGVVFLALIVVADIPATASIAVAFAYLILFAALMAVGPVAFGRISNIVNGAPATATGPHTSSFDLAHA
jgi:hypothetical protein